MTLNHDLALPSAFGLTFLLFIGLGFFIRASTKDRTEDAAYVSELEDVQLLEAVQKHFDARSYRIAQVDPAQSRISLQGMVKASVFLAVFLGMLAGIGLLCLALVLAIAFPDWGYGPYVLLLLIPVAPWFYWRGATRVETLSFQLIPEDVSTRITNKPDEPNSKLMISAHRDELIALEAQVPLKRMETE